jgi:hypothetical protein
MTQSINQVDGTAIRVLSNMGTHLGALRRACLPRRTEKGKAPRRDANVGRHLMIQGVRLARSGSEQATTTTVGALQVRRQVLHVVLSLGGL